jgi:hypothetical protein
MEINSSNGAIVFFEAINQSSHAIIPKLNGRGMERDEDPWSERHCQHTQVSKAGDWDATPTSSGGRQFLWHEMTSTQTEGLLENFQGI